MAITHNVANFNELMSALNGASGGDVIQLSSGSYGSVTVSKKYNGTVTITSEGGQAKFSSMELKNASNVTIDDVSFSGGSHGLKVSGSSNIKVLNSDFSGLSPGASFTNSSGVTVSNNNATSLTYDAFRFGG